jgi:ABC-type phosphate transport system ATPase subunit
MVQTRCVADRVALRHFGGLVEIRPTGEVFRHPETEVAQRSFGGKVGESAARDRGKALRVR